MFERIILILLEGFECLSYGMTAPNDMSATTVPSASGKPSQRDSNLNVFGIYLIIAFAKIDNTFQPTFSQCEPSKVLTLQFLQVGHSWNPELYISLNSKNFSEEEFNLFSEKETIEKLPLVNSGSSQANLLDLTTLIVKVPAASN